MQNIPFKVVSYPGRKLKGRERYQKLYHYTSFDTFVKIWLSQQLRYSPVTNVNDIQEAESSISAPSFNQMPIIYAYNEIRQSYKQISFTMDFDRSMKGCMSPMMWGHYGDKRKGVCIEIDYEKLNIPNTCFASPVKYKTILNKSTILDSDIYTIKQIHKYIKSHKKDIFFTKQKCWEGENEYRIVSNTDEYLDISGAISAVYLTSCDSNECIFVEKLVGDKIDVKYLHYVGSPNNKAVPILSDTRGHRDFKIKANSPTNGLFHPSIQAKELYEKHKDDENFVLGLNFFN